jgi:hypothetical protein
MPTQLARSRKPVRRTFPNPAGGSSSGLVLPFDHAASFELKGIPGNIIQDVINISSDGTFVAVAIGYGLEEDRARPAELSRPDANFKPEDVKLSEIPIAALIEGFRFNPRFERLVFNDSQTNELRERTFLGVEIPGTHRRNIIERLKPAEEVSFLFSIVDSGTGRELQDEPIHNLASLGISNGARPFRMLAQPLTFQPRSTIRLQIVERSEGIRGTLFIVLYGYKTLGVSRPAAVMQPHRQLLPGAAPAGQSQRVIPFDYVASFQVTGSPGNQLEEEIPINVEGGFVATSIGYGLGVETLDVTLKEDKATIDPADPTGQRKLIKLSNLELKDFSTSALQEGIRIRSNFIRVALQNSFLNSGDIPLDLANRVFERLNRPEDVSFRYSIVDSGTGRELQNQPINNIAGLGIANGDRPFKKLARPMLFLPRSTIRVSVEERFGRGNLFIVFQGYKRLGGSASSQSPMTARSANRR